MDAKISELPASTALLASDSFPIVTGGVTKSITSGIFSLNLPNIGNKGISKNAIITASVLTLPITGTLLSLPVNGSTYVLPGGSTGQEITLISAGVNVVDINTSTLINLITDSVLTVIYTGTKWVIKSKHNIA